MSQSDIRYKVVRGHFYHLVLHFEQSLATTAARLFEAELIDSTALEEAENSSQLKFERCSALLRKILSKIEENKKWYDTFLSALCNAGLNDIVNEIKAAFKREEQASHMHPLQHSSESPCCSHRHSAIAVDPHPCQRGLTAGNFPTSSITVVYNSPNSEVQTPIVPSPPKSEHVSNDEAHNEGHATTIIALNKRIQKLEEDRVKDAEEVERKGKEISEKNDRIARLEADCMDKDHDVKLLKSDKAKMEKKIVDLEKKSRKEIQSVHDSYKERLQKLQEDLEDVQLRETKAQIELANAETLLAKAMLDKEREISDLKDKFHKLKETAAKEKELAAQRELAKEKELMAHKEREIATREELVEEKQKRAQDLVSHVQDIVCHAKGKASQAHEAEMKAKEEARVANLRVQKLEAEKIDAQDQLLVPELELYGGTNPPKSGKPASEERITSSVFHGDANTRI